LFQVRKWNSMCGMANKVHVFKCKHGKVDQENALVNVNLEVPLESDQY
jgi:hypothetical protein